MNATTLTDDAICERDKRTCDSIREKIRAIKTQKLLDFGSQENGGEQIKNELKLTVAQSRRFEFQTVSLFQLNVKFLAKRPSTPSGFRVLVCCAKDDEEARKFQKKFAKLVLDDDATIVVDATSVPFSENRYDEWLEFSVKRNYWNRSKRETAKEFEARAVAVLDDWLNAVANAPLVVRYRGRLVECSTRDDFRRELNEIAKTRFPNLLDDVCDDDSAPFYFSELALPKGFRVGATLNLEKGYDKGVFNKAFGSAIFLINFGCDEWWSDGASPLARIKIGLDRRVQDALRNDCRVSVSAIVDYLVETEGFMPNRFYAMITGFLTRNYFNERNRCCDSVGTSIKIDADYFAGAFANAFKRYFGLFSRPKINAGFNAYIYEFTQEFQTFVDFVAETFGGQVCDNVEDAIIASIKGLTNWRCPLFAFRSLLDGDAANALDLFFDSIVTRTRDSAHRIAKDFVDALTPETRDKLKGALKKDRVSEAFVKTLESVADGEEAIALAKKKGRDVVKDVQAAFPEAGFWLWDNDEMTFGALVRKLANAYRGEDSPIFKTIANKSL